MECIKHRSKEILARCQICGQPMCGQCRNFTSYSNQIICHTCLINQRNFQIESMKVELKNDASIIMFMTVFNCIAAQFLLNNRSSSNDKQILNIMIAIIISSLPILVLLIKKSLKNQKENRNRSNRNKNRNQPSYSISELIGVLIGIIILIAVYAVMGIIYTIYYYIDFAIRFPKKQRTIKKIKKEVRFLMEN